MAFPVALKRELRGERDLRKLKNVLSPEDLAELQNAPKMVSHTLLVLSAYILKAHDIEEDLPKTFLVVCKHFSVPLEQTPANDHF